MADEPTHLIMEQLHILRRGEEGVLQSLGSIQKTVEALRVDLGDVKVRMTGLEMNMPHMQSQFAHLIAVASGDPKRLP
jgi:hypothetical protein